MKETASSFLANSSVKAADLDHREKVNFNIHRYNSTVPLGKQQFTDVNLARERAKNIKWRTIESLDQYLEAFEANFTAKGGKVLWAETSDEALKHIQRI